MKEITRNIKEGQFHKVYLLTGDEGYLILQASQLLRSALLHEEDEMNFTRYDEARIDLSQVADLAVTYPFFSRKRVILFHYTNIVKTGKDEFLKILKNLPETTCIIICDTEVDKRCAAYKWIKKNGYVAEFLRKNQKENTLLHFLVRILAKAKKQIREEDARYFLSLTGDNMFQIRNEAEKLISYLGDETVVSREAIDRIVSAQIQDKIFDMVTALARKERDKALSYYNDLMILREAPMHILFLIVRQYRILLVIRSMGELHKADSEIAKAAGIPPFTVKRYRSQLRLYEQKQLVSCLEQAVKLEEEIKTGIIHDQIGLEMLLIRLSEE